MSTENWPGYHGPEATPVTGQQPEQEERTMANNGCAAGGGAIYGLGMFGALFYFWQQAGGFWEHAYALFQAVFWPAYMVFEAFTALNG